MAVLTLALSIPFQLGADMDFAIEGSYRGPVSTEGIGEAHYRPVMPGYFEALRIGLVRDRLLEKTGDPEPREIIGVVRDVHELGLHEESPPILYLPVGQMPPAFSTMLVRLLPQGIPGRWRRRCSV